MGDEGAPGGSAGEQQAGPCGAAGLPWLHQPAGLPRSGRAGCYALGQAVHKRPTCNADFRRHRVHLKRGQRLGASGAIGASHAGVEVVRAILHRHSEGGRGRPGVGGKTANAGCGRAWRTQHTAPAPAARCNAPHPPWCLRAAPRGWCSRRMPPQRHLQRRATEQAGSLAASSTALIDVPALKSAGSY